MTTGRLTKLRAAGLGALSGIWLGLFVGLLFGLFIAGPGWLALVGTSLVLGAGFGSLFGYVSHAVTFGRRDFTSFRTLNAEHYAVHVETSLADQARTLTS